MTIKEYISKLEQAYMANGYSKQQVDSLIVGFKLGVEFAGNLASGVINDLLVAPFADQDTIIKEKRN